MILHQLQMAELFASHLSLFVPLFAIVKLFANFKRTVSLDAFIVLVHNEEAFDAGSDHGADFEAAPVGNGSPPPLALLLSLL